MSKERYNEIIDEVYQEYDELFDSYHPPFSAPYPTRLTKEELVEEIKKGGHDELGVTIEERELSLKERIEIANRNSEWMYDVKNAAMFGIESKLESYCNIHNIPTKEIKMTYNKETITVYV